MLTDEQRADGWIEHDGGACPVAGDAWVRVAFREGIAIKMTLPAKTWVQNFDQWRHMNQPFDIIAYKLENRHE